MQTNTLTQIVRCPNCGSAAIRHYYCYGDESTLNKQLIQTECSICDYLMKMRSVDGSVIEAYAPSTNPIDFLRK
ncbi:MAG: replication restart DNA helicase PriA [Cyanobacteria bacterium P01_G01_bin.39]